MFSVMCLGHMETHDEEADCDCEFVEEFNSEEDDEKDSEAI